MQKQPPRGVPRKRCSENMQQIYRRTPMPKRDFNKVALQHTSKSSFLNISACFPKGCSAEYYLIALIEKWKKT